MMTHAGPWGKTALLVLSCIVSTPLRADSSPKVRFEEANALYAEKRFEEASEIYSGLADEGVESPELYYNLGNAFYKSGKIGRAIQFYEKAKRLLPRDRDVLDNLSFARKRVAGAEEDQSFTRTLLERTVFAFTVRELVVVESVSVFLFALFGLLALRTHKRIWRRTIHTSLVLTGSLVALSLLCLTVHLASGRTTMAIVVEERVEAMSGPGDDYVKVLSIPEGTTVWVDEERNEWRLIHLGTGRGGWVRTRALGVV
jgi:hypothetical protein